MEIKKRYDRMLEWKELDNGNSALFIEGATGKYFSINFGK